MSIVNLNKLIQAKMNAEPGFMRESQEEINKKEDVVELFEALFVYLEKTHKTIFETLKIIKDEQREIITKIDNLSKEK